MLVCGSRKMTTALQSVCPRHVSRTFCGAASSPATSSKIEIQPIPLCTSFSHIRRYATRGDGSEVDKEGRRIRSGSSVDDAVEDTGWENFDPTSAQPRRYDTTGWVGDRNDDEGWDDATAPTRRSPRSGSEPERKSRASGKGLSCEANRSSGDRGSARRDGDGCRRVESNRSNVSDRGGRGRYNEKEGDDRKINLRALELAGFDHLYGLASVLNALQSGARDFSRPEDRIQLTELEGEALEHELKQRARKPEAQYSPWLFVQDSQSRSGSARSFGKATQAGKVLELAKLRGIPVASVDKGVLNTLSNNRPHQGYVLRCGKLFLDDAIVSKLPLSTEADFKSFWLVLDEVVDPQNFGALLRSAHFIGSSEKMGILICSKNSAPPSPVVSAASAGALELMAASTIFSTSNLPRTMAAAEQDGFRIVGASSSVPKDLQDVPMYNLQDLPVDDGRPTVLILGSEGHGLRPLVAKACTEFVRIPPGVEEVSSVDSLNVSVTGGILLWHFLQNKHLRR